MAQQGLLLQLILVPHICNQLEWAQFPPGNTWRPHPTGDNPNRDAEHFSRDSGYNGKSGDSTSCEVWGHQLIKALLILISVR